MAIGITHSLDTYFRAVLPSRDLYYPNGYNWGVASRKSNIFALPFYFKIMVRFQSCYGHRVYAHGIVGHRNHLMVPTCESTEKGEIERL